MRYANACIWKLEKDLNEIITLLRYDYSEDLDQLTSLNLPELEKKLNHRWSSIDSDIIVKNEDINNEQIEFINVVANMEINNAGEELFIPHTQTPLPKVMRTDFIASNVLFVKRGSTVYAIVKGAKSNEGKLRRRLMISKDWGEVNWKPFPEYSFDKSFYYWILRNKGEILKTENNSMHLIEVKGFSGSTDRNAHEFSGKGSNIDNQIPLKSLISMDETLISLHIKIQHNNFQYSFSLNHDSRISVDYSDCVELASQDPKPKPYYRILLDIYFEIIPFLRLCFNSDSSWKANESAFKKDVAIKAIKELIQQNNIDIKELA